jgi:hypothetical protein
MREEKRKDKSEHGQRLVEKKCGSFRNLQCTKRKKEKNEPVEMLTGQLL